MPQHIGVNMTTGVRPGPTNTGVPSGRWHIPALTEYGPLDAATLITDIGQFEDTFGARTAYNSQTYDSIRTFFEEGGAEVLVSRVVGPGATAGSVSIPDAAGADAVVVTLSQPGGDASNWTVVVQPTTGTGTAVDVRVLRSGRAVARYNGVTSADDLAAQALGGGAVLVKVTGVNPTSQLKAGTYQLTGGSDDRTNVGVTEVIAALNRAGTSLRGVSVSAPGYSADAIGERLLQHAYETSKVALLAGSPDETQESITALAATLSEHEHADHGGLFFPHLIVPDGSRYRVVGPEAYAAAARARAATLTGYWEVPAGLTSDARWVLTTQQDVDVNLNDELAGGYVNGIITVANRVRLYGWSSLSTDRDNFPLLSDRDSINNLVADIADRLEEYLFRRVDATGMLRAEIESTVKGVCEPLVTAGALYPRMVNGERLDDGYSVNVSGATPTASNQNVVRVLVGARWSPTAALIEGQVIRVNLHAGV